MRASAVGTVRICDPSGLLGLYGSPDRGTTDFGTVILGNVNGFAIRIEKVNLVVDVSDLSA